jgi:hypothetical protein
VAARFGDAEVFAVMPRTPLVYTAQMKAFYPREYNPAWTWRWMGSEASWKIVNRSDGPIVASVDVEMTAFHVARRLELLLDGWKMQTLIVEEGRHTIRLGPLVLTPGDHLLAFHPADPPTVANEVIRNGDRRPLSLAVGTWRWTVRDERP